MYSSYSHSQEGHNRRIVAKRYSSLSTAMPVRFAVLTHVKALNDTYKETCFGSFETESDKEPEPAYTETSESRERWQEQDEGFLLWKMVEKALDIEKEEKKRASMRSRMGTVLPKSAESGRSRDLAAKKAGFRSFNSYFAAKNVYLNAHKAVLDLVEKGILKLTPASVVAKLPYQKQHLIAQLVGSLVNRGVISSGMISYLIYNSNLTDEAFLIRLRDKVHNTTITTRYDIKMLIESCIELEESKAERTELAEDSSLSVPNNSPDVSKQIDDRYVVQVDAVRTLLCELLITRSQIQELPNDEVVDADKIFQQIEKIAGNIRGYLRIHSDQFTDSFKDLVCRYLSSFKESVQFFAHELPRRKDQIDESLYDELNRTFHNAFSLLHSTSIKPVLPLQG